MAGIINVPSFWDYLGQGIDRGHENFLGARQRQQAEAERQLGVLAQLFQAGAIDSSALEPALGKAGISGVNVQENSAEARRRILGMPQQTMSMPGTPPFVGSTTGIGAIPGFKIPGQDQVSDDEMRFAGLQTSTERMTSQNTRTAAAIRERAARGETITPQEATLAGIKSNIEIDADTRKNTDPLMSDAATRYVSGVINRTGRLSPNTASAVAQQAFDRWKQDRARQRLGALTPEEESYAQSFFDNAVRDAMLMQEEGDRRNRQIDVAANRASTTGDETRWYRAITQRGAELRRQQQQMLANNPMLGMLIGQDPNQVPEFVRPALIAYNSIQEQINLLDEAQANPNISQDDLAAIAGRAGVLPVQTTAPQGMPGSRHPDGTTTGPRTNMTLNMSGQQPAPQASGGRAPTIGQTRQRRMKGNKEIVTKDQEQYLKAIGAWDSSKYVVE